MNNNKLIAIIIVLLIIIVGGVGFMYYGSENTTKISSSSFSLPEGYHVMNKNQITIGNDSSELIIIEYNSEQSIDVKMNEYYKENENKTIINDTFEVDGITVRKATAENNKTKPVNYWYEKNNKTYRIHSDDTFEGIDDTVKEIVSSTSEDWTSLFS